MRAVIIGAGSASRFPGLGPNSNLVMLPVGDRPIVQHVVERLLTAGFRQFDLVLADGAQETERLLGEGQRWGCAIRYHLTTDHESAVRLIPSLARAGEPFLLAHGDFLPQLPIETIVAGSNTTVVLAESTHSSILFDERGWTGWAWISSAHAARLPVASTWTDFSLWLRDLALSGVADEATAANYLTTRDPASLLRSQVTGLTEMAAELQFGAFISAPGIWIGRNVTLPPTVALTPPVLIGDNSEIGKSVQLGPNAVVGSGCLVDENSLVADSIVLHGSYVGRHLHIENSIVQHNWLWNVGLDTKVELRDPFLLGRLGGDKAASSASGGRPGMAVRLLAALAAPLVLLVAAVRLVPCGMPVLHRRTFVASGPHQKPLSPDGLWPERVVLSFLPQDQVARADGWRHFLFVLLPGLLAVAAGRLHLVGIPARSAEELRLLPEYWRELCLETRPGLISEAFVVHGPNAGEDELYAADAICAATGGWRYSSRLLTKYAGLLALGRPAEITTARN